MIDEPGMTEARARRLNVAPGMPTADMIIFGSPMRSGA
jgi:hypothetical protein